MEVHWCWDSIPSTLLTANALSLGLALLAIAAAMAVHTLDYVLSEFVFFPIFTKSSAAVALLVGMPVAFPAFEFGFVD